MRILLFSLLISGFAFADGTMVTGYVDAGFKTLATKAPAAGAKEGQVNGSSGWMVNSGSVYISHGKGEKTSLFVELPFMNGGATTLMLGNTGAQAYLTHKCTDNLTLKMGQFASIYGFEMNASTDRFFSNTGMSYSMLPGVTHTGFMASYMKGAMSFDLLTANTANTASAAGAATTNDDGQQMGFKFGWMNKMYRASLGYIMNPGVDDKGKKASRTMTEIMVGGTFNKIDANLQYNMSNDPSISTAGAANTNKKSATNMMLHLVYSMNEKMGIGFRYETLGDNTGNAGLAAAGAYPAAFSGNAMALGVNYKESDHLQYRFAYHTISSKASSTAANSTDSKLISLNGLYSF